MAQETPEEIALLRIEWVRKTGADVLFLGDLGLTEVPSEIGILGNITFLDLDRNQLTSLPAEIGNLGNLRGLALNRNQFTSLPAIGNLGNLTHLLLEKNQLTSLPAKIGNLGNLTHLYLTDNQLTSLPAKIGNLGNLTSLCLDSNQLRSLPAEIGNLTKLKRLKLRGNPLPDTLIELAGTDVKAALAYLRDSATAAGERLYEAKMVLVGEGDVGKTCLLRALQGAPFEDTPTTKGMEVDREPLNLDHPTEKKVTIKLNAWDFGGQPEYRVTHQFFFSPRSLYLVVWDPRSGHDKCDVDGWIGRIRLRVGDDAVVLVVATHTRTGDPPPPVNLDRDALKRKYGDMIAGFFEVDSYEDEKTKRHGIDELRNAVAAHAEKLRGMGDVLPAPWKAARDDVLAIAEEMTPWIPHQEFADVCRRHNVLGDSASAVLTWLHELGQIVYFGSHAANEETGAATGDRERLADVVVLRPEWLAKAVCFVLDDEGTGNASGVLRHDQLKFIWHDDRTEKARYDRKLHPYFLALMEEYDVSYRLGDATSLVPQLIRKSRPADLPWYPDDDPGETRQLALACQLDQVPSGLIPLMIVRTHRFSREDNHWELGAFLDYGQHGEAHMALVDRELIFTIRGDYPPHFMTLLTDSFEVLVSDVWRGLKGRYQLQVPCPTRGPDGACKYRFKLDGLRQLRQKGLEEVPCLDCLESHRINDLLDGLSKPGLTKEEREEEMAAAIDRLEHALDAQGKDSAEWFRLILASMHNETAAGPGMFSFIPENGAWAKLQGKQRYTLTLWCEYPDCPHPLCAIGSGGEGEYVIEQPADWLLKVAPYVTWTAKVLKVAAAITAGVVPVGLDGMTTEDLKAQLALMEKCAGVLPGGELEADASDMPDYGIRRHPGGAALREFHDLLKAQVKGRRLGGLRRVLTKTGDHLWLCPKHYDIYEPPLPIVE